MVDFMNSIKAERNLEELALKIDHMYMNLKELKKLLKPIRAIQGLNDLILDI